MDVTFIQTADPIFYAPMLQQTSRTVRQFCTRNGFRYESYVGIKRGTMPWHATYNRVYMLKEMVDRGLTGWVFYMDADAYIGDMDFDVRQYLSDKYRYAGILSGYMDGVTPYSANAGGFAVNLSHVMGRQFAIDYWKMVTEIPDSAFNGSVVWGKDIPEDQWMLFKMMEGYWEGQSNRDFLFERVNFGYTNHGPFIRQSLRDKSPDFRSRMATVREEIDRIMRGRRDSRCDEGAGYYLPANHPRVKTAVGALRFNEIRTTGTAGMLLYGPYLRLRAGNYVARLFGEVRATADGSPARVASSVTMNEGRDVLATWEAELGQGKGLLLEHRFTAFSDIEQVEVTASVSEAQDISIHAVQIHWTDEWVPE